MTLSQHVALINPNTDPAATAAMLEVARGRAPVGIRLEAITASTGPEMIVNQTQLNAAGAEVGRMAGALAGYRGVIVAAFGNPGVEILRSRLAIPIVGIGEAAMLAAVGRRFAVVTSTPELVASIKAMARSLDLSDSFEGVFLTRSGPLALRENLDALRSELLQAALRAMRTGVKAIIVGGGPFVAAAVALDKALALDIIQPIPAAVAEMHRRLTTSS